VQLSRELARRGHEVLHLYAGYNRTPRGALKKRSSDPDGFQVEGVFIRQPLQKYSFLKRWSQEIEYGHKLAKRIRQFNPDVVISANTPLDAQSMISRLCKKSGIRFVFWLQDVLGMGAYRILKNKIPLIGSIIGSYYIHVEKNLLRNSDGVVSITEDFLPLLDEWGVEREKVRVIHNWAPLEDLNPGPKDNPWSRKIGAAEKKCILYTGTLGMKHNPDLLLRVALLYRGREDVCVMVVSEGPGADWLRSKKEIHGLDNLEILDYQPFEALPDVMGAGDILLAILEPEAGIFSPKFHV